MALQKLPVRSLDTEERRRLVAERINGVLDHSFDDSRVRNNAEIQAGIYPVNPAYPPSDVRRYGALGDGATDDTAAILRAISVAQSLSNGGYVYFPEGDYLITGTLTISANRIHLFGDGPLATRLLFAPTANDVALEFNNGANANTRCSLRHLSLFSNDSTYTKTAVDLYDTEEFILEDIVISGSVAVDSVAYWGGADSIGIRTRGRQTTQIRDVQIQADRPILISVNPNVSTIDADHFHFQNLYIIANDNPCVEAEDGVVLSNVVFDGTQAWVKGTHGFYWVDATNANASFAVAFKNIRLEQGTEAADFNFRIEARNTAVLQSLSFENCYLDPDRAGFYIRNTQWIDMRGCLYAGTGVALNLTAINDTHLSIRSCFFQTGGTATLTNVRRIWQLPTSTSGPVPHNAEFVYDGNASRSITCGGSLAETDISVANGAVAAIGATGACGLLVISSSDGGVGVFALNGTGNDTDEIADGDGIFSATAGTGSSTNVYWSAGNSRYEIENNRGATLRYKFTLLGSYNTF